MDRPRPPAADVIQGYRPPWAANSRPHPPAWLLGSCGPTDWFLVRPQLMMQNMQF